MQIWGVMTRMSEIRNDNASSVTEQHISCCKVSVDNSVLVDVGHALCHLCSHVALLCSCELKSSCSKRTKVSSQVTVRKELHDLSE